MWDGVVVNAFYSLSYIGVWMYSFTTCRSLIGVLCGRLNNYSARSKHHWRYRLDNLQSRIERTCSVAFQPLGQRRHAAIMGLVCRLLAGEGRENLSTYCPQLCGTPILRRSHRLHSYGPAEHLRLVNFCNFKTLDRFKRRWLATAKDIWNGLPADMILRGEVSGWHTVLKDIQRYISS